MSRFDLDVGKLLEGPLSKLSRLAPALVQPISPEQAGEPAETGEAIQAIDPAPEAEGASETQAEDTSLREFYSRLSVVPGPTEPWNRRELVLCRERDEGRGEDAFMVAESEGRRFFGVFDGCGGSGAKVYPAFDGHTGAWVASRATALAAREWFEAPGTGEGGDLSEHIRRMLDQCKAGGTESQLLMGSLSREFPTTAAAFDCREGEATVDFHWCGDSRCYVLDGHGLHQVTVDDAAVTDAMRNLREDAPMTNVICASRPFVIHARTLEVRMPAVILAATDGCYGYLHSPMDFEALLLETMSRARSFEGWRRELDARLREVSGDDYTLVAWPGGFKSYGAMRRAFGRRLAALRQRYPQQDDDEAALDEQWQAYRVDYEAMLPKEEDGKRG